MERDKRFVKTMRLPYCFITRSKMSGMSGFKLTFCASMRILVMEETSSVGREEAPVSLTGAKLVGLALISA